MTSIPIRYQTVEVLPESGCWIWRLKSVSGCTVDVSRSYSDEAGALTAARETFQPSNTSIRLRVWRDGVWVPEDWWK